MVLSKMDDQSPMPVCVTRAQKVRRVKQLYKEGRNVKEIAKEVHLSFTNIKKITNEVAEEIEKMQSESAADGRSLSRGKSSIDSQAFTLFSKGKTPVDVAIGLKLDAQEVERMYADFLLLSRLYKLRNLYSKYKKELLLAFRLVNLVKEHGIEEKNIVDLLKYSHELPQLDDAVQKLEEEIYDLRRIKSEVEKELLPLLEKTQQLKKYELEMTILKAERCDKDLHDLKSECENEVSKANQRYALREKMLDAMRNGTFKLSG
jgi:predicted  nucleic acid-binding Zn-ribbon protein